MTSTRQLAAALTLLAGGCATMVPDEGIPPSPAGVTEFAAVRALTAPAVDGVLDDPCWRKVGPVTEFLLHGTACPAQYQTFGYVCYDESRLYIGIKCLVPEGVTLKGAERRHDSNAIFRDEIVEVMIDPGRSRRDYYQLVLSAHNATFDCSRAKGGKHEDDAWDGDWEGRAHVGDGYWSAELAVPYHNLGVTAATDSTWGLNLCRESPEARELSTLGADGMFNHAWTFAVVNGIDVDFCKYAFRIGPEQLAFDATTTAPRARLTVPVVNRSGSARTVRVERHYTAVDGRSACDRETVDLADGRLSNGHASSSD